jgi:hypothetical protein
MKTPGGTGPILWTAAAGSRPPDRRQERCASRCRPRSGACASRSESEQQVTFDTMKARREEGAAVLQPWRDDRGAPRVHRPERCRALSRLRPCRAARPAPDGRVATPGTALERRGESRRQAGAARGEAPGRGLAAARPVGAIPRPRQAPKRMACSPAADTTAGHGKPPSTLPAFSPP